MKAKKGFNWLVLIVLMAIVGILVFMVVQDFLEDFQEAEAKEEVKDFREMGVTTFNINETEPIRFYFLREDLAEEQWGRNKFVFFKCVGENRDILVRVNYSTSRIEFDPDKLVNLENLEGSIVYPDDSDWDLWFERFKIVLERYAEKQRRLETLRLRQKSK